MSGTELAEQNGVVRQCTLTAEVIKFHLFVDSSSVELFVNDGEEVFTSRIFPSRTAWTFVSLHAEAKLILKQLNGIIKYYVRGMR